ncbi:hypothetical protein K0M31_000450 [Melipona bicolor]|uniref:Uncharacterized protein n=1 Tax=Melipona bicolor TaxID=60889 RepID=A0AA40GDK5_9HYME|nr:hypothetical protein K0M31_000450 [Melipona bicolor]
MKTFSRGKEIKELRFSNFLCFLKNQKLKYNLSKCPIFEINLVQSKPQDPKITVSWWIASRRRDTAHFENRFLGVPAKKIAAATPSDSELARKPSGGGVDLVGGGSLRERENGWGWRSREEKDDEDEQAVAVLEYLEPRPPWLGVTLRCGCFAEERRTDTAEIHV